MIKIETIYDYITEFIKITSEIDNINAQEVSDNAWKLMDKHPEFREVYMEFLMDNLDDKFATSSDEEWLEYVLKNFKEWERKNEI